MNRHLDYPSGTPSDELGPAALEDLLDRGDLEAWRPLARAVHSDPWSHLADTILTLCDAHPMYGTSAMWRIWIERLRGSRATRSDRIRSLADLRRGRGMTQQQIAERMGILQSDVSKLERRTDFRISTLHSYVDATGGRLHLQVRYPDQDQPTELSLKD